MKGKLLVISALVCSSVIAGTAIGVNCTNKSDDSAIVREVELDTQNVDYESCFNSFSNSEVKTENGITTFTGEKKVKDFDPEMLDNLADTITEEDKDETVKFEFTYSDDMSKVIISASYSSGKSTLFENLEGYVFTNENGDTDAVISLDDGSTILMSELQDKYVDNCKWLSKLIKGIVATVAAVAIVAVIPVTVPAVVAVAATAATTYSVVSAAETIKADENYKYNRKLAQPTGYVNGQKYYSDWKIGVSTFDKSGCGVIAAYNVLRGLKKTKSLAQVAYEFDSNSGTLLGGVFGADPSHYGKYFAKNNIKYTKYSSYDDLTTGIKSMTSKQMLLLCKWNGTGITKGAHYISASYNASSKTFTVYNRYTNVKTSYNLKEFSKKTMGGNLITAYIVG